MTRALIRLANVDVVLGGQMVLRGIHWQLKPGEHWAILGGNGSGKTTLLKLIRGDLWPAPARGQRVYSFDHAGQTTTVGIRERIGLVSPELHDRYLEPERTLTGLQVVQTGFFDTDYLCQKLNSRQKLQVESIVQQLGLGHLMKRTVQELSRGELRNILIARALSGRPRILMLDEVCDGLDASSRAHLLQLIESLARSGTQILQTTHRREEIIPAITHALVLEDGRIVRQGGRDTVVPTQVGPAERRSLKRSVGANSMFSPDAACGPDEPPACAPQERHRTLIRIERANVFLARKKVLRDVHWEMRADQNWAILGPNGAGKSALVKLILGDLHPAWGARVQRFGLTARSSVWDLKRKISSVSPELQANYRESLTGAEVIASGFFSSIGLIDRVTHRQRHKVRVLMQSFHSAPLADRNVLHLSYGEFRKVLLLRALVNGPRVLICDEPFDGLDVQTKAEFAIALEQVSREGTRLIVVTHHLDDLPECITHGLWLEKGRIRWQGEFRALRERMASARREGYFGLPPV